MWSDSSRRPGHSDSDSTQPQCIPSHPWPGSRGLVVRTRGAGTTQTPGWLPPPATAAAAPSVAAALTDASCSGGRASGTRSVPAPATSSPGDMRVRGPAEQAMGHGTPALGVARGRRQWQGC